MNKTELVDAIAAKTGESKASATRNVDALLDTVKETVAKGEPVTLIGFGTFTTSKRAARTGRNPRTGAALNIAASTNPTFKAGKAFKDAVKK